MKGRKATVFWVNLAVLVTLYVVTALTASATLPAVAPTIIWAIIGNGAAYIGGQVADAWQKSKYFRAELNGVA